VFENVKTKNVDLGKKLLTKSVWATSFYGGGVIFMACVGHWVSQAKH
jgi:hypothetical protein